MAIELDWMAVEGAPEDVASRSARSRRVGLALAFAAGALCATLATVAGMRLALDAPELARAVIVRELPVEWRWSPAQVRTSHMFPSRRAQARLGRPLAQYTQRPSR